VCKALNNLAPQHLIDDCQQLVAATGRRDQLRSSDNFKCAIISTNSRLGDRAFASAGPRLGNSLPVHIRQPALTLDSFFRQLKTLELKAPAPSDSLLLGAGYKLS